MIARGDATSAEGRKGWNEEVKKGEHQTTEPPYHPYNNETIVIYGEEDIQAK